MVVFLHRALARSSMVNVVTQPMMTVGRYAIFDEIASGGMASVHLARLRGLRGFSRIVVAKRLFPHLAKDPSLRDMLADEARMTSRVRHPNVVPVLDVVSSNDELVLILEYVPGVALHTLLRAAKERGEPVDPRITVALIGSVLRGLHAAHTACDQEGRSLGLVHRDVSPDNILVGSDGLAHLVDFGIAKAAGRIHQTLGEVWKGKPAYMAPEQLRDSAATVRSDVYACAVVLWEALTGHGLFHADNEYAVSVKVFEKIVDPPSRVANVPQALDAVVLRGLSRDPQERFETAREMATALDRALEPAAQDDVQAWLESLGGALLREREKRVREVESAALEASTVSNADERVSQAGTPVSHVVERRKRGPWGGVVLLLVLAVISGWVLLRKPDTSEATKADAPDPMQVVGAAAVSFESVESPGPREEAGAAEPASTPAAKPEPARPARVLGSQPRKTISRPSCDPPYEIDEEGFHRIKRECL